MGRKGSAQTSGDPLTRFAGAPQRGSDWLAAHFVPAAAAAARSSSRAPARTLGSE